MALHAQFAIEAYGGGHLNFFKEGSKTEWGFSCKTMGIMKKDILIQCWLVPSSYVYIVPFNNKPSYIIGMQFADYRTKN